MTNDEQLCFDIESVLDLPASTLSRLPLGLRDCEADREWAT
jgi:hypothetical protein